MTWTMRRSSTTRRWRTFCGRSKRLAEITDASRETYVKLETIRQKIRYLKDEDKKTAQDALEEKQSAFDEILAEEEADGADGFTFQGL